MDSWIEQKLDGRNPLDVRVYELEFSVRALSCFKNNGIRTVRDIVAKSEFELMRTPNFGRKSLNEVKEMLNVFGLKLRDTAILSIEEQMTNAMARARAAKVAYAEAVLEVQRVAKLMVDAPLEEEQL